MDELALSVTVAGAIGDGRGIVGITPRLFAGHDGIPDAGGLRLPSIASAAPPTHAVIYVDSCGRARGRYPLRSVSSGVAISSRGPGDRGYAEPAPADEFSPRPAPFRISQLLFPVIRRRGWSLLYRPRPADCAAVPRPLSRPSLTMRARITPAVEGRCSLSHPDLLSSYSPAARISVARLRGRGGGTTSELRV